jgi:diguanylate cyclase (GGDEF)-like protein
MEKQLKTQSLPLSVDNIYTDIQKHVIEPYLVSSMMASDTFMKDWLMNEEENTLKIQKYLDSIKNRYGMLASFLVSQKSQNYYTQNGLIEKISKENPTNAWYFKFKDQEKKNEINLDLNANLSDSIIMFINFKILDDNFNYLGATGVGIKISYIHEMLQRFKNLYKLKVMFLDKDGNILLAEDHKYNTIENIESREEYKDLKEFILSNKRDPIEYIFKGSRYILNTKYIKELDIHLLVEAKLDDFTHDTKQNFYLNLSVSLFLTFIIAIIIIRIIREYNDKLADLAKYDTLTKIPNRRTFQDTLQHYIALSKRNSEPLALLFIDIDDFKYVNDNFGHKIGDEVLKEVAYILKTNTRTSDICGRWGGEEFVLAFLNSDINSSTEVAEKIRTILENSLKLKTLTGKSITISAGITLYEKNEALDNFISRADSAMYEAKKAGKNKIVKI